MSGVDTELIGGGQGRRGGGGGGGVTDYSNPTQPMGIYSERQVMQCQV